MTPLGTAGACSRRQGTDREELVSLGAPMQEPPWPSWGLPARARVGRKRDHEGDLDEWGDKGWGRVGRGGE